MGTIKNWELLEMNYKTYSMEAALECIIDYRGKTPQKADSGIPTLSAKSVRDGYIDYSQCYFISEEEYQRFMVRGFPQIGDVLLTTEAPLGVAARLDRSDIALAQRLLTLRGKHGVLDTGFLYYYLRSPIGQAKLLERQTGTTVTGIKQSEFRKIEIFVPDINAQEKIAYILSKLDDKIRVNTQINENLRQQATVIFDSYYSIDAYIPMKALSEIATIKYGKGLPTKELLPNGFPVFGGNGIIGRYNSYLYERPQILVSCRGAASGNILVSYPKSFVTNNSLVLELYDYRYFHFIKQYLLENPLYSYATGSAQPQITIDNIKDVQVPYPEYDSIQSLTEQLSYYADMHYHNICENERLASIRDALLPKLMSGELDVS